MAWKKTLLVLVFLYSIATQAQKPHLVWKANFEKEALCNSNCSDKTGNIYVYTALSDTIDVDPGPAVYTVTSNFIAKYNPLGQLLWAREIGVHFIPSMFSICCDDAGNVYAGGTFYDTVDFDPGPGEFILTARSGDIGIVKYDSSGIFQWAGNVGSTNYDYLGELATDADNNLFIAGSGGDYWNNPLDLDPGPADSNDTTHSYTDAFLIKVNANGQYEWSKKWSTSAGDYLTGLCVDPLGNIIVSGTGITAMDLDPGPGTFSAPGPAGYSMTFMIKLGPEGDFKWANTWVGGGDAKCATDLAGNIALAGGYSGSIDLDPGAGTQVEPGVKWLDSYLIKIDPDGQFIWGHAWQDSGYIYCGDITIDINGNILTSGFRHTFIDFDPGPGIDTISTIGSYVMKFSAAGNYKWSASFPMYNVPLSSDIVVSTAGEIYLSLPYAGVADLDPGPDSSIVGKEFTTGSALVKLQEGGVTGLIHENPKASGTVIFPNPTGRSFTLKAPCGTYGKWIIHDQQGRVALVSGVLDNCEPYAAKLSNGLYHCTWSGDGKTYQLVVE